MGAATKRIQNDTVRIKCDSAQCACVAKKHVHKPSLMKQVSFQIKLTEEPNDEPAGSPAHTLKSVITRREPYLLSDSCSVLIRLCVQAQMDFKLGRGPALNS